MKKIYSLLLLVITSVSFGQTFTATYDFAGVTTTSGTTDPSPVPTVAGLTFGSFTAVVPSTPTIFTGSSGAARFSFPNQPLGATNAVDTYSSLTGTIDTGIYYQVTVTPVAGTTYNLTGITFRSQRSGTGIRTYAVRSSADAYASNLPASINPANAELTVEAGNVFFRVNDANTAGQNGSTITLSGAPYTGLTGPITFRFYGFNAEGSGGNFSIDDVAISGNVTALSTQENTISGLNVYPNPVKNGIFYITTDANAERTVTVFDIVGKQVLNTTTSESAINVANLNSGVYMVQITEEGKTATKKLVIR